MKEVNKIILEQIEDYNDFLEVKIDTQAGDDTILFGHGGVIDSVDFVTLLLDIEEAVNEEYDKHIAISNARAMSQKNSPFRTVGTLAEYIKKLLEE